MKFFNSELSTFPVEYFTETGMPRVSLDTLPRNKYGYRGRELEGRGEINLLFIGDGWTEGVGVEYVQTYPSIVARGWAEQTGRDVREFNLGHRDKGYDYVARVLWCALRNFRPDFVFVCFPPGDRREYFAVDSRLVDYSPARAEALAQGKMKVTRVQRELIEAMHQVFTPFDVPIHMLRNYLLIDALLGERGIDWAYATNGSEGAQLHLDVLIEQGWFSAERRLGRPFTLVDRASDGSEHPGPASHAQFGAEILKALCERYPHGFNSMSPA